MTITCPKDHFDPVNRGAATAAFKEEHGFQFAVGDRIRYEELDDRNAPTGRSVTVVVTDVYRTDAQETLVVEPSAGNASHDHRPPDGMLTVHADNSSEEYPGFAVCIDGQLAAVVQWHPGYQSLVIRTYNDHDEEPQHYHRWNGTALES